MNVTRHDQYAHPLSDLEIAQSAALKPIVEVAREKLGVSRGTSRSLRSHQGQTILRSPELPRGEARRQADPGHGDHADPRRRGQDHDDGRARRRAQSSGQAGHRLPARTQPGALLRDEGRRGRRRLCASGADGGDQPPFHWRLPRDRRRQQSAGRDDRQSHLLGRRAGARSAAHHLAPRARYERPRATENHDRPGRGGQWLSARGWIRHHRRLRNDGGVLPRLGSQGFAARLGAIVVGETRDRRQFVRPTSKPPAR